jgi:DNA topoisomerase-1
VPGSRIVYGTDDEPGIRRHGHRRFRYTDERRAGRAVTDPETLDRIRRLAVPPAWTDVWISPDAATHVQATGRDARGRKQYRYHGAYRSRRDAKKFDQLVAFGRALPAIREAVDADLRRTGLPHDQVVALVVALLDRTLLRVGNESYVRDNGSFGLTTLRCRHAEVQGRTIRLRFRAKSAQVAEMTWSDARLARLVRRCREVPGQVLFQWLDETGGRHPVRSDDVNDYVRRAGGLDITAKTFRTWGATLLAAVGYAAVADTPAPLRAQVSREVITAVAAELGNTPAVCRASYVHPGVVEAFHVGTLPSLWRAPKRRPRQLLPEEHRLLHLLEHVHSKPLELRPASRRRDRRADTPADQLERARQDADETVEGFADQLRSR